MERRKRKSLVEEAKSRHLKVASKSSAEIQKMISKDKRTQPSLRDLLSRKVENNTTYEEVKVKEEEEEEEEREKKEEETAVGDRRILVKSWSNISDTKEEIVERREGQRQELEEEEESGSVTIHTMPYPSSVTPKAMKGESQEGIGRCSILGVGNRILGPAPNNVKQPKTLGGPVEDECHLYSSRN